MKIICDAQHALQQNKEQVTQAYFEIWTIEVGIGLKNNPYVDFQIFSFIFFFFTYLICFYHCHVISDWFSHFKKNRKFLQSVICKPMGIGNSQNHTSRETAYSLIHKWLYPKRLEQYEFDFAIKLKLKDWKCAPYNDTKTSFVIQKKRVFCWSQKFSNCCNGVFFFFFFFFSYLLVWITNLPSILLCLLISGILTNLYIIDFKTCRRLLYLGTEFIICIGQPCSSLPTVHFTVSDCSHTYL